MAERAVAGIAARTEPSEITEAVKEAFIAACIALILFIAIVGIKTENAQEGLQLIFRIGWAIGLAAAIGILRLIFDLFVWRRILSRKGIVKAPPSARLGPILTGFIGFAYLIGAAYYLIPGAQDAVADAVAGLFTGAAWQARARTFVELTALLFLGIFVVLSAMAAVMLVRLLLGGIAVARPGADRVSPQTAQKTFAESFGQQFAPALLVVAVILPILVAGPQERYALDTAIQVLTYIMLGWGLNIVVGLAGLLDLGYVAFYAVGAYSYALIATEFGWSFWVCLPLAGAFAALWGIILGFPVLRLRGDYLAIVTLAFGEIIRVVLLNWYTLTNGPDGISRIPKITFFGLSFDRFGGGDAPKFHEFFGIAYDPIYRIIFLYYIILLLALMVNFATQRLRRLPIGRAWEAMREDEIACRSLGINVTTTKLTAFSIGAMFGGFAGSFFATRQGFISPESFTFQESALVLAVVVLGGLGSQIGVVIAAVVLIGSSEFFRELSEYRMLIFGASMVTIMVWRPRGIISSRAPSVVLKERKQISGGLVKEGAG
jgi:branched-chain amino acid transport system permease protein